MNQLYLIWNSIKKLKNEFKFKKKLTTYHLFPRFPVVKLTFNGMLLYIEDGCRSYSLK